MALYTEFTGIHPIISLLYYYNNWFGVAAVEPHVISLDLQFPLLRSPRTCLGRVQLNLRGLLL